MVDTAWIFVQWDCRNLCSIRLLKEFFLTPKGLSCFQNGIPHCYSRTSWATTKNDTPQIHRAFSTTSWYSQQHEAPTNHWLKGFPWWLRSLQRWTNLISAGKIRKKGWGNRNSHEFSSSWTGVLLQVLYSWNLKQQEKINQTLLGVIFTSYHFQEHVLWHIFWTRYVIFFSKRLFCLLRWTSTAIWNLQLRAASGQWPLSNVTHWNMWKNRWCVLPVSQ